MPGIWSVRANSRRRIDVKTRRGSDKGRMKDEGYELASVELTGRFISPDAWERMQRILRDIHPKRAGGIRQPLYINHPATNYLRVDNIYINDIESPSIENGIMTLRMRAIEWVPQPKKKKKAPEKPDSTLGQQFDALKPVALTALLNLVV